jgi:hypothetical protein
MRPPARVWVGAHMHWQSWRGAEPLHAGSAVAPEASTATSINATMPRVTPLPAPRRDGRL